MKGKFKMIKKVCASIVSLLAACAAWAGDLAVSAYWQDHMVIQRGKPATVWGKGTAGRTVTVSFANQTATGTVAADGNWEVTFANAFECSTTSQTMTVSDGSESLTRSDILVGDVYLCAGQSNMHMVLEEDNSAVKNFCRIAADNLLRAMHVPENQTNGEQYDLDLNRSGDQWGVGWGSCADEEHRMKITSVGLNFACYIRQVNPGVPVGVVQAAFRGAGINGFPQKGLIWNAMIAPYKKAKLGGVLWYQAETDSEKSAETYASLLHDLVTDWRSVWGADLPFYAVQVATPGSYYGKDEVVDHPPAPTTMVHRYNYTAIREGLRLWNESETGTHGLAVICDFVACLQGNDLHPKDKNTVGRRLSLFARHDLYGESSLQTDGPKYDHAVVNADGSVTVSFKSGTATGLTAGKVIQCSGNTLSSWTATTGSVKGFALQGADGTWYAATATVNGTTVVLTADEITTSNPAVQFHYGYWNMTRDDMTDDGQRMNLYNASGLPLSPIAPQMLASIGSSEEPPPATTYSITVTTPQNGTLATSATSGIAAGTTITVTATPATGYQLKSITVNGAAISGNTFVMPTRNVTVAATFEQVPAQTDPETPTTGNLEVSAYWQNHMVLQRNKRITVWGKDAAGRSVTVSFAGQTANAVTGSDGFWETTFAQTFAVSATPRALTITDNAGESLTLSDILVGDVFLAAGQSNMDRRLVHDHTYEEPQAVKDFCQDDDGIRFIRIARSSENTNGQENLFDLPPHKAVNDAIKYFGQGYDWAPAVDTHKNFVSSLALNFAHYIRQTNAAKGQDIPIGIIHASSGGTAIRSWLRPEVLTANGFTALSTDGGYWNNMMAPIKRAKFRAILWYQGCSDAGKTPDEYKQLMDVLVKDRRDRWGDNGDLPFYAVQIGTIGYDNGEVQTIGFDKYPAPSMSNNGQNYAFIREAQRLWDVSDTGTHGLAVILDHVRCMDKGDLHPVDKNFVARRLSLFARRDLYGEPNLTTDGPVFSRAVREADGAVRISFKPGTAKGLTSGRLKMANDLTLSRFIKMDGPVKGFAICGSDGVWKEAEATIEGETVVLRAQGLSAPTRFHYGFWSITRSDNFEFGQRLSLYNGEGLPLSPLAPMDVEVASTSAKTADPVFLPGSGLFNPTTNVTLSCATAGATIRYTANGSEPTASSPAYTAPIAISATTTIKARAFVANKEASDVVVATYTRGTPAAPTVDPMWSVCPYDASTWTPLANNVLAGKNGTTAGGLAWGSISKDAANLTDGTVPVTPDGSKLVGFCDNSSITYTFTAPQTITELRLSTRIDGGTGDLATRLKYAGLHIQDVYVKKSGSSSWEALGTPVYQHTSLEETGGMMFALADDGIGHLAENVVGLKIDFLKGEVVWSQVAEIEASGYATADGPTEPLPTVATPTVSPASCSFYPTTNVTLACATAGATIRYTLDGSTPTASSTTYTAPIAISATTTVKARAFAPEMNPSATVSATYTYTEPTTPGTDPEDPPVVPPPSGDQAFYVNGTGYDTWADAMNAAKNGDTVSLGADAEISGTQLYSLTIDLCGHTLTASSSSAPYIGGVSIAVTDSVGGGLFTVPNGINLQGTIDLSALGHDQFAISGNRFWTGTKTVAKFPAGWTLDECKATFRNTVGGAKIVTQGVTYTYDADKKEWVSDQAAPEPTLYAITVTTPSNGTLTTSPSGSVAAGTTVTVTATAAEGYQLASITVNGTAITGNTFTMPEAAVTVAATFEQKSSFGGGEGCEEGGEANPTWTTVSCAPSAWQPLANNLLLNVTGTSTAQGVPSYASTDLGVLTDGAVPTAAPDKAGIFGIRNNDTISWTFAEPKTLGQIRISSCYLTGAAYDGVHVSKVEVMKAGSSEWSELAGEVEYKGESAAGKINCAVLSSGSVPVAKDIVGLKVTFGTCETGYANYYAEIEASGTTGGNTPADPEPTLYAITVTAPENGTLVTSPSGSVAAGTTVTVTATAAEGYQLATITLNGTAIDGNTFTMPAAGVTLAATFQAQETPGPGGDPDPQPEPTQMFYIGETGYDSWTDAYGAAKNGDTIVVGKDAQFAVSGGKPITIDLCGRSATWNSGGYAYTGAITVIDSGTPAGSGSLTLANGNQNTKTTVDLSALTAGQITGTGRFYFGPGSKVIFPRDMSYDACVSRVNFQVRDAGPQIVVQGVTYDWDGEKWVSQGKAYPDWLDATVKVNTDKYDAWSAAKGVADPTAALEDAYLLNCANTVDAVAAAKAAFKITSIAVGANGTAEVGLPEGDFNGTVSILGCETVNGEYHARKTGDHFFKAVLTK